MTSSKSVTHLGLTKASKAKNRYENLTKKKSTQ
jgi:hypothetical protein